jgi:CRP-like cAMP-binding protein
VYEFIANITGAKMLREHSLEQSAEWHVACGTAKRGLSAQYTPRQNRLLAALPHKDYERLLPDLEPIPLPQGLITCGAADEEKFVYFLTAGIVSRFYAMECGASAEFAVTGNEGVVSVASFLGGEGMPSQAVMRSAGFAFRLGRERLKNEFRHYGALSRLLLRYTMALMVQTGQAAACNRHHSLGQRLCRLLLSYLDRLPSDTLATTHEQIADSLGVRRESVTDAVGRLQHAGLIRCTRGRISLIDRPRLEAQACECYAVVKQAYDRLLPEYERGELKLSGATA